MDVHFLPRDLRKLDEASPELVACAVWRDKRPFAGLAGLLDWRLAGKISKLAREGFLVGEVGEALFIPGRPRLPFDKVLVLGLGPKENFGPQAFGAVLDRLLRSLEGLQVRRAVVELPGRADSAIEAQSAADLLFRRLDESPEHDAWWLVDDAEGERCFSRRVQEEKRRARS